MLPPKIQIKLKFQELESLNRTWIDWQAPKGEYKTGMHSLITAIICELAPTMKAKELRFQKVYRVTLKLYQAMALHVYWKYLLDLDKKEPFMSDYAKKVYADKFMELDQRLNSI